MRFEGFYGNNNAKEQLSRAFDSGRLSHAVLIDGPEGSGKRSLAGIIARAVLCDGEGDRPCGHCRQCLNALGGNHPDIVTCTGTGGARSFSVDTVRKIRLDTGVAPNDAAFKVYILLDVHNMTEQAQNALLKMLEEPPSYVMFILTCVGRSSVLETVQSRVSLVTLGPIGEDEIARVLVGENPELAPEAAQAAARLSGGILGRAKKGLAQGGFSAAAELAGRCAAALRGTDEYRFLRLSGLLEKDRVLLLDFLEVMPLLFRDALAKKAGVPSRLSGCGEETVNLAAGLSRRQLYNMTQCCIEAGDSARKYANTPLLLTSFFSRLWVCASDPASI